MSKIKKKSSSRQSKNIPSQEDIYEKAFKQVDRDESGAIPLLLLNKLLKAAGEIISEDEIDSALEYMKKDKEEDSFTFEEFKKFIEGESKYQWWSRCEYEIILESWPSTNVDKKWDVHRQVMMNIDIITSVLMDNVNENI